MLKRLPSQVGWVKGATQLASFFASPPPLVSRCVCRRYLASVQGTKVVTYMVGARFDDDVERDKRNRIRGDRSWIR